LSYKSDKYTAWGERKDISNVKAFGTYRPCFVKIEKNETGGAYSTYEGKEKCIQDFGGETTCETQYMGE
jgi:hypothetical protein